MSHITLLGLPAELLCHILVFLDGATYDLIRVRETCKALKALIDNSETLQYIIDLCYFRMTHVPGGTHETNVTTHRRILRQHEDAWRTFGYRQKCALQPASTIHVVGDMYGSIRGDRIYFARLSSLSDPDDVHSWSHPIDVEPWLDFTFCPEQDLFVVVTPNDGSHLFDIHLRSLTTNEVHPNAAHSVLEAFDTADLLVGGYITFPHVTKLRINENYIVLHCRDTHGWGCVQVLDWKCRESYQFILPLYRFNGDCSFIAEDKLLVSGGSGGRAMDIYSITNKCKYPQVTVRLSLPSLMRGWSYVEATTGINPSPGSVFQKYSHQPSCFFHPSLDDQLIFFHILIADECSSEREFFFFARRSAILRLERLRAKDPIPVNGFPWSSWGLQNTTWFLGDCRQSLYGFRTTGFVNEGSSNWPFESRRLCIRDFNPHNICDYGAGDETGRHGRLVRGGATTTIMNPFTELLGSALPYRETISEELFVASETIMDESRILLRKRDDVGLEKFEVLLF